MQSVAATLTQYLADNLQQAEPDFVGQYRDDKAAFIRECCFIYDNVAEDWIPFRLWDFQVDALNTIDSNQLVVWIKARQIGATWLVLADILHRVMFRPIQDVLIFSRRKDEAVFLLDERLRGMYKRLPQEMQDWNKATTDTKSLIGFTNGSRIRAFPTGVGDSYTVTYAFIDESDLAPNVDRTIVSVKPTIDAGGKMVLVGRVDKQRSNTILKRTFKNAQLGKNDYAPIFVGWHQHPLRDQAWYDNIVANADSLDDVHEQYPATPEEAMSRAEVGKIYPKFSLTENVSPLADYDPNYDVEWWIDDGYINPLVILFTQTRPFDGYPDHLCVFDELYLTQTDHDEAFRNALVDKKYKPPRRAFIDPSATRLIGRLQYVRTNGLMGVSGGSVQTLHEPFACQLIGADNRVAIGIKTVRNAIGPDANGIRRLRYHPRCTQVITEMSEYATSASKVTDGGDPKPVKENDHGCDATRYGLTPYMHMFA